MRFGRIPKREKQRLLDEMQSYMNSLNESASLEMEPPTAQEAPLSPAESQSKEAIGAISRAYQDIFVSTQDRLNKRVELGSANGTPAYFQNNPLPQEANRHGQANSAHAFHSNASVGYASARCPVAQGDKNCPVSSMNSSYYNHPAPSNQNHCPHKQASATNLHQYNHSPVQSQGQGQANTCPWKLAAGSKVLVSLSKSVHFGIDDL